MSRETSRTDAPRDLWVGVWLVVIALFVFAMILVGGATRLTDSGLSITEWDLAKGLTPPLSDARWAEEFALYQRTTEYQLQNRGMSLAEFQSIYWWEWGHRFLGKMIGVIFALPFFFFLITGRLKGRFWPVLGLFALGALQGAIGWWMVTSGLWSGLDVSPLRLAVHLGMAFLIIAIAMWLALDAFGWPAQRGALGAPAWTAFALAALIFVQVIFGAILAGADGGPAYADWPLIGGQVWPQGAFEGALTQNHATQHLLHRTTGYVVALAALALAFTAWRKGEGAARDLAVRVGAIALFQAGLGVVTVLTGAHFWLSLLHQATAAFLWLVAVAVARSAQR